jgi:hypothetical protein
VRARRLLLFTHVVNRKSLGLDYFPFRKTWDQGRKIPVFREKQRANGSLGRSVQLDLANRQSPPRGPTGKPQSLIP